MTSLQSHVSPGNGICKWEQMNLQLASEQKVIAKQENLPAQWLSGVFEMRDESYDKRWNHKRGKSVIKKH